MKNLRFCYQNQFDLGTLTYSSQHPSFPAKNIRHRWHNRVWRSRFGTGSGWGNFVIDSSNKFIDFDEGGGELTATLAEDTYNADTLATEIQTKMIAAGGLTYVVAYSNSINKFTISAGANFTLKWADGTNKVNSVGDAIGFDITVNDAGASSYEADYRRIHTEEWIKVNRGANLPLLMAAMLRYNNFSASATVQFQAHASDSWGSPSYNEIITVDNTIMIHFLSVSQSLQWIRIRIRDVANSDGYIKLGRPYAGPYVTTVKNFNREYSMERVDPSLVSFSEGRQSSSIEREKFKRWTYAFTNTSKSDKDIIDAVFISRGKKDFFLCQDADDAQNTTYYLRFLSDLKIIHVLMDNYFDFLIYLEELK